MSTPEFVYVLTEGRFDDCEISVYRDEEKANAELERVRKMNKHDKAFHSGVHKLPVK